MNTAQDRKKTDHNGYWYIEDNPISRAGVFQYLGSQISEELEPDRLYNVYRPAEELFSPEAMKSFELIPFVNDHEMLGKGQTPAEEYGVHGVLGEKIGRKGDMLTADIKIYSEALKDEINNGKKELSLGYYCDYDLTPGTYKGQHYDAVQRNLRGNHIALVDKGRMGHDVRVMDGMAFDSISVPDGWITIGAKDPDEESGKNGHKGKHIYINAATGAIEKGGPKEWQGKTQKEVFGKGKGAGNTSGGAKPAEASPAPTSKTTSPTPAPAAKSPATATPPAKPGTKTFTQKDIPAPTEADKKEVYSIASKLRENLKKYPQKDNQGKYKLSDFKIKKETQKAYLLSGPGLYETWIPKSTVKEGLIADWKSKDIDDELPAHINISQEQYKYSLLSEELGEHHIENLGFPKKKYVFPDGSSITRLNGSGEYEYTNGIAEEKVKILRKHDAAGYAVNHDYDLSKDEKYPAEDTTDTADFSGETEAQAAAKEKATMDKRELIREIAALSAKDPAEFKGGTEEKVKAVTELAETLAYGDGKEDKPEGDDITTAPPEEEEKKTETETETETETKTENENKEEDAAKCDAEPQAVQGTRLEIKALPPEKDDMVKKAADMAAEKVSKNIYEMQELKARITPHIGEFDSSKMRSVADMADYALRKMGKKAKGDKVAYLEGCLSEMKQERQLYGMASDGMAADEMEADTLDEILKGVK